jgi:hypothetical protein
MRLHPFLLPGLGVLALSIPLALLVRPLDLRVAYARHRDLVIDHAHRDTVVTLQHPGAGHEAPRHRPAWGWRHARRRLDLLAPLR